MELHFQIIVAENALKIVLCTAVNSLRFYTVEEPKRLHGDVHKRSSLVWEKRKEMSNL